MNFTYSRPSNPLVWFNQFAIAISKIEGPICVSAKIGPSILSSARLNIGVCPGLAKFFFEHPFGTLPSRSFAKHCYFFDRALLQFNRNGRSRNRCSARPTLESNAPENSTGDSTAHYLNMPHLMNRWVVILSQIKQIKIINYLHWI